MIQVSRDMRRERHIAVHETCQSTDATKASARDFDMVRSKLSTEIAHDQLIIEKLKTKKNTSKQLKYMNTK